MSAPEVPAHSGGPPVLRVVPQPACAEELQAVTETGSITCGQNVWVEKVVGTLVKADPVAGSDQAT